MLNLSQLSAAALARPPEQPAIEFETRWYRWGELRQLADQISQLLAVSGSDPSAPVAFIPRNHPSAIAALLALIASGRTVRMIYAFQSATAIARNLEQIDGAVLVASAEDCSEPVLAVLKARGIAGIALEGLHAEALPGLERSGLTSPRRSDHSPQIEILTSGTTGPPKPFAISYALIAQHIVGVDALRNQPGTDWSAALPCLLFFPLGNISGIYSTLPAMLKGQRAVLLERFTVGGWHDYVLRYRPEVSGLPPAGVQMVLDADIPPADLSSLRRLGTGAAPLDPSVHRAFEQRYGIPILLSYGATEFGGPVTAMTPDLHSQWGQRKFGSVGRALPGAQLRIVDPDNGTSLAHGTEGLLEVVSPRLGPHWIRTSDLAVLDEDGFLFHRGRADGAILRGGFKLLPETIEQALLRHPAISAAAVTALADARLGQVPVAAVQFKPGAAHASAGELEAHLRDHVYATHIPVHWRFVAELPRTVSLKVDRPALRRLFDSAAG